MCKVVYGKIKRGPGKSRRVLRLVHVMYERMEYRQVPINETGKSNYNVTTTRRDFDL